MGKEAQLLEAAAAGNNSKVEVRIDAALIVSPRSHICRYSQKKRMLNVSP